MQRSKERRPRLHRGDASGPIRTVPSPRARDLLRIAVRYPDPEVPVLAQARVSGVPSGYHQHAGEDWEFCFVASGQAHYRVGEAEWLLQAGDLLTVGPDEPHACLGWRGERSLLIFKAGVVRSASLSLAPAEGGGMAVDGVHVPARAPLALARRPVVQGLLRQLQDEMFCRQPAKEGMCTALVVQFLIEAARSAAGLDARQPRSVGRFARQTIERLCGQVQETLDHPWTRAELARRSGYSPTQLNVLFRLATGMSPCAWLAQQRVRRACELLTGSDQTVVDIAAEVGFGSRSQFYRVFEKAMHVTPGQYRHALRHDE